MNSTNSSHETNVFVRTIEALGRKIKPRTIVSLAFVSVAIFASQANAQVFPSAGTSYSASNPLAPLNGGLGPQIIPKPSNTANADFFEGDSITFGYGINNQATYGCSGSPGLCFADLVSTYDGVSKVDTGLPGSCLEYSSLSGSPCNSTSTTTGPLIYRYANDDTQLSAGMRYHVMIGTNDLSSYGGGNSDSNITTTQYAANLLTVTNAAATIVCPPGNFYPYGIGYCLQQNMVLIEIPYSRKFSTPMWYAFNTEIARLAVQKGYALAATASVLPVCALNNFSSGDVCQNLTSADYIHPDNLGHAAIATAVENASYGTAVTELAAQSAVVSEYFFNSGPNFSNGNWCEGMYACLSNVGATNITAIGYQALRNATTGALYDSAYGPSACYGDTTGYNNTCIGANSVYSNSTAHDITSEGYDSLKNLTSSYVTADGSYVGYYLTTGNHDVLMGFQAGEYYNGTTGNNTGLTQGVLIGDSTSPLTSSDTGEIVVGYNRVGLGSNSVAVQVGNAPGFFSGSGAPTFPAPNASIYMNYAGGTGARWYANTSGASTSGTTWTALSAP